MTDEFRNRLEESPGDDIWTWIVVGAGALLSANTILQWWFA